MNESMKQKIERATILLEALPYIRQFFQKTAVVKYGGHAIIDNDIKQDFVLDLILLNYVGINLVVVHGGGPQIEEYLGKIGKASTFVDGMRITDKETLEIVEMVLIGKINQEIVGLINQHDGHAIGLSGRDGSLIKARKMKGKKELGEPDLGLVGEVVAVNPEIILTLNKNHYIPIIAPLGQGEDGKTYNINADIVAGKISSALKADKLILLTDVDGVLDNKGQLMPSLMKREAESLLDAGIIKGGMIPKVRCCLDALDQGVKKTHIINGKTRHALLLELFTEEGIGTQILKDDEKKGKDLSGGREVSL